MLIHDNRKLAELKKSPVDYGSQAGINYGRRKRKAMQSRGKQEKNADRENRIERDEEYLRLFQRGQKILGGGWILVMAVSALLFLSGIYFTLSGRGEWIDMAAVLIPFLITGAILLFLASPYKKGAAEVKNTAGLRPRGGKAAFLLPHGGLPAPFPRQVQENSRFCPASFF